MIATSHSLDQLENQQVDKAKQDTEGNFNDEIEHGIQQEKKTKDTVGSGGKRRSGVTVFSAMAMIFVNTAAFFVPEVVKNRVKLSRRAVVGVATGTLLLGGFIGLYFMYGGCESYNIMTRGLDGMEVDKCNIDPNTFFTTLRLDTESRWEIDAAFSQSKAFWQVKFFGYGSKAVSHFQDNLETLRVRVNQFLDTAINLHTFDLLQYFLHTRFVIAGDLGFAQLMSSFSLPSYAQNFELSQVQFFRSHQLFVCARNGNKNCQFKPNIKKIKSCGPGYMGPFLSYDVNQFGSLSGYYKYSQQGTEFQVELNLLKQFQDDHHVVKVFDGNTCDQSFDILGNATLMSQLDGPIMAREVPYFEECRTCRFMNINFDFALINALDFCNKNIEICSSFYNFRNDKAEFSSTLVYVRIQQIAQSRYRTSSASFYDDTIGKFVYTKYELGNEYSIVPEIVPVCADCQFDKDNQNEEGDCTKEFNIVFHYYLKNNLNDGGSRRLRSLLQNAILQRSNVSSGDQQGESTYDFTKIEKVEDFAAALLEYPDLIKHFDAALQEYGCDLMEPLIVELQCQKNKAPASVARSFKSVINQPQYPYIKPCLTPYENECKDLDKMLNSKALNHLGFIDSKSYYYSLQKLSWPDSFQRCQSLGGNLLQLDSKETETTINILLQTNPLFHYTKPNQTRTATDQYSTITTQGNFLWIGLQNVHVGADTKQKWTSSLNSNYSNPCAVNFNPEETQSLCAATFFEFEFGFPSSCWEYVKCEEQNVFICEFIVDVKEEVGAIPQSTVSQSPPPPPPSSSTPTQSQSPTTPPPPPIEQVLTSIAIDNNEQNLKLQDQEQIQILVDTENLQAPPKEAKVVEIQKSGYKFQSGSEINSDSYYQFSVLVTLTSSDPFLAYNQFQTFMPDIQCDGTSIKFAHSNQSVQVPFTLSSNIYECEVEHCFTMLEKLAMTFANTEFFYIFVVLFMVVSVFICCSDRSSLDGDSGNLVESFFKGFTAMAEVADS